jgi:hypothetical protein
LNIIISSSVHIVLKKETIFEHFDAMYQSVVIKGQGVQHDFNENQTLLRILFALVSADKNTERKT